MASPSLFPRSLRSALAAVILALAIAPAAAAMDGMATVGDLAITNAWTRQSPPSAKVGGGYLTITNNGAEPDRLVSATADHAPRVEIHEMAVTDGVMRMAPLPDGLVIAPGETVELKPGGYHVMFMNIAASPVEGDVVSVTLAFERAGEVTVTMPVAAIGASSPGGDAGKMNHSTGHSGMKADE